MIGVATCRAAIPLAPGLQAKANTGVTRTITLTWNKIYNATGYTIQSSLDPSSGFTNYAPIFSGTATTYTTPILDPTVAYYFRIKATNAAGSSPYSNVASATTGARSSAQPLAMPTALQGTVNANPLAHYVSWNYSLSGATFVVSRATNIDFQNATQFTTAIDARNYTDTNVTPGTVYFYKVRAQLSSAESDDTSPVSLTATGCTTMGSVGNIELTALTTTTQYYYGLQPPTGAISYVWNFLSPEAADQQWSLVPSANGVQVTYNGSLPYTGDQQYLIVAVADNCGSVTTRQVALPIPGGKPPRRMAAGAETDYIAVYPNPAIARMNVTLPQAWRDSRVRLVDLKTGQAIREWQCNNTVFEASLEGVSAGIYLLEFQSQDQIQRQRLEVAL